MKQRGVCEHDQPSCSIKAVSQSDRQTDRQTVNQSVSQSENHS